MLQTIAETQGRSRRTLANRSNEDFPHLTPNERMVYAKMVELERSVGAYELLDLLRPQGVNAIPTIYRALKALEEKGVARHLASTRTFVALQGKQEESPHQMMLLCDKCQVAVPVVDPGIGRVLHENAQQAGFAVSSKHLEVVGTCQACQNQESI